MTIKVYYDRGWYGFNIIAKEMPPASNTHVEEFNYNLDNFKIEVKKRFGTDDIEFIEGLENFFKERYQS